MVDNRYSTMVKLIIENATGKTMGKRKKSIKKFFKRLNSAVSEARFAQCTLASIGEDRSSVGIRLEDFKRGIEFDLIRKDFEEGEEFTDVLWINLHEQIRSSRARMWLAREMAMKHTSVHYDETPIFKAITHLWSELSEIDDALTTHSKETCWDHFHDESIYHENGGSTAQDDMNAKADDVGAWEEEKELRQNVIDACSSILSRVNKNG